MMQERLLSASGLMLLLSACGTFEKVSRCNHLIEDGWSQEKAEEYNLCRSGARSTLIGSEKTMENNLQAEGGGGS